MERANNHYEKQDVKALHALVSSLKAELNTDELKVKYLYIIQLSDVTENAESMKHRVRRLMRRWERRCSHQKTEQPHPPKQLSPEEVKENRLRRHRRRSEQKN